MLHRLSPTHESNNSGRSARYQLTSINVAHFFSGGVGHFTGRICSFATQHPFLSAPMNCWRLALAVTALAYVE
jgi:hypothetical protein